MEEILSQIRDFADQAHGSQMRKYTPERYIVHPVRVMQICRAYDSSLPVLSAALLHDVLEDTAVKKEELLQFLLGIMNHADANETLSLVEELTDVYVKPAYPQWNRKQRKKKELDRIKDTSPKSQTIKYADILDNTREITSHDPGFAPRYLQECLAILRETDKGNEALYRLAIEQVKAGLNSINKA